MVWMWVELLYCYCKKVGVIIVCDGMIIFDGYNGIFVGFDNCCENVVGEMYWYVLYVEVNVILKVVKFINNCWNVMLYFIFFFCKDCSKLILQVGIKCVVFFDKYKDIVGLDFFVSVGVEVIYFLDFE